MTSTYTGGDGRRANDAARTFIAHKILPRKLFHTRRRLRNLAGGKICDPLAFCAHHRHRFQRHQRTTHRATQTQVRTRQPGDPPASAGASWRSRCQLRSGSLHRRAASFTRPGCRPARLAARTRAARSDASDGVCALRAQWHLYAAGVLPARRLPRARRRNLRAAGRAQGPASAPPAGEPAARGSGFPH